VPHFSEFQLMPGSSLSGPDAIEQLQRREARYRAFLEFASQGLVAVEASGTILLVNAKTEELFGYTRDELLGAQHEILLPKELRAGHVHHRARYFQQPRTRPMGVGMDLLGRRKDGTEFPVEISLSYIEEPSGILALAFITDITERKRIEDQLRETQKLEGLGVLAGGIAHDFNNLLTGIIGNASLLAETLAAGHPGLEKVNQIATAGQRAADLTRQLLAYAGKGRFQNQSVNVNELVQETSVLVQSSIPSWVKVSLDLASNLPRIEADASQIQQLLMNLIINAAEAILPDHVGRVLLSTRRQIMTNTDLPNAVLSREVTPGEYVLIEVYDNGRGMTKEEQTKIFDPFFTTKFMGRGLGLAAALGIIRGHRGKIAVDSTPGAGSRFKVLLPAASVELPDQPQALPEAEDLTGHGLILVIDDKDVVRHAAKSALQHYGYSVVTADDGSGGIDLIRQLGERVRLIILDMTMPGMSGEETLNRIRAMEAVTPVLLSSGFEEGEAIHRFKGKELAGFVQKPYTAEALARAVKRTVKG
jgi:two-component system, chemotaxis family, CheB/CheR fusion protein